MNDYDQAARYAARRLDEVGFLHWTLGADVLTAWRWLRWLDTQTLPFPGEQDRRCDTVAAFERRVGDAVPVAAVVEFMSNPRGNLPERLADYLLCVRRDLPYQTDPLVPYDVVGVVVNLTGAPQADVWEMAPPDFAGLALRLRMRVRTLREEDAMATLAAVERGDLARCVLAWVSLMAGADRPDVVAQWRRLALLEPDERKRGDLGGLVRTFATLAKRREVWERGLEGYNVQQSEYVQELRAEGVAIGKAEGVAIGKAEGVAIGKAEGVAIGKAEGVAIGKAEGVAQLQRKTLIGKLRRWDAAGTTDLVALVQSQTDLAILDRWFDAAMDANSLDELRTAITAKDGLPLT